MLPIFALMVIFLVVVLGAGFDVSRAVNAREKLSYALDAAALTVATDLSTSVMTDAEITQALTASFKTNLQGTEFLDDAIANLTFSVDSENGIVRVASKASLKNYFIDFGGYGKKALGPEKFEFGTSSQVSYSRFDVELALVVDVTGSMAGDMKTLRSASEGLVNILIPADTDEADSKVRISLVPYSQGVNLGAYAGLVKGGAHGYSDGSVCVSERQDYKDGNSTYKVKLTDDPYNYFDKTNPPPKGTFYGGGSDKCAKSSAMIPLTADRADLIKAIKALESSGGTSGQTGVVWGWNSLSPNYANLWPADSEPAAYDDDRVLKFAVIMTDGDNNRYYKFTETRLENVCTGKGKDKTCQWKEIAVNAWEEVSEGESYSNTSSTTQRDLCEAMKDAKIEVFGVYFGSNNNSAGAKNMKSCASDGNYYQATSASGLIAAFANIARKIQSIYLSM
ncbi:pilus assembly protein TadG-related protein [Roseibium sediminicola]|uniref:Pilus assembly protein n=1 Tax=Roseibium sediminicola TaxID=2933272 RepID=A0ABT0GZH1_9HYPH|nr:pilus assembly protein [Roseibium sp. CAU 1639]